MSEFVPLALKQKIREWRLNGYCCEISAISEILENAYEEDESGFRALRFLRRAQFEALETYWYLRLVEKTPKTIDLMKRLYGKSTDLLKALGVSIDEGIVDILISEGLDAIFEKITKDDAFVKSRKLENVRETLGLDYPSYIFALAMGAGKTYLIGAIIATEFAMAFVTKMLATRKSLRSTLTLTINIDEFLNAVYEKHEYGRPLITVSPKWINCSLSDLRLKFQFRVGNKIYPHSTLTFGG